MKSKDEGIERFKSRDRKISVVYTEFFKTVAFALITVSFCIRTSRKLAVSSLTYTSKHIKTLHSTDFVYYPSPLASSYFVALTSPCKKIHL